jgi:5-hydroxyisourate hydrolase
MSAITTHVLDTASGRPGRAIEVTLEFIAPDGPVSVGAGKTDDDGRCRGLIPEGKGLETGSYRLTFEVGQYFGMLGMECFFSHVSIAFEVADAEQHYHVPLLVSPFGYSTYRGS